ncbi:MAG: fibronectin type III [Monoraphidium minutum]|nr:MAG: fibronectin type III [Monoraphidium minutum]
MSIPPTDDPRQAEVQARFAYSVSTAFQMQLVPTDVLEDAQRLVVEDDWMTVLEAACCNAEVTSLRPGRFYAVRICCTTVATAAEEPPVQFDSSCSPTQLFRTVPTPPGPMQPPALSQRARNALKLKWALPEETGGEPILQYVLEMTPAPLGWEGPPGPEGFFEVYSGDERSYKIVRLAPGTRYTFHIMAFNQLGPSPWSLCSAFTTQASVPAAPEPPLQVSSSADSVSLRWAAPPDNGDPISGYTLEVDDGAGGEFRLAYSGPDTAATVSRLKSGLPYRFRLQAENTEGRSFWSTPAAATTAATAPSIPVGLAVMGVSQTSVTLAWQPPASSGGSPVTGYEVQLQAVTRAARDVLGDDWLIVYDGDSTATTFSALQPGCSYMARVSARNAAGSSPFSIAVQVTAAPDVPAPPALPDAEVGSTSLLLKWLPPGHDGGSPLTGYRVEMRCSPSQAYGVLDESGVSPQHSLALTPHYLTIYSGPECCVQVTDLMPGTTYEFRVMAINGMGGSLWSPAGDATTRPSVPLPPPPPSVSACSSHSLHLSWREPYGQGAPVTGYTVNMARAAPAAPARGAANGHGHAAGHASSVSAGSEHSSADLDAEGGPAAGSCGDAAAAQRLRFETVYTGPATACDVRSLEPATAYVLRVRAHNLMGGSAWGEAATVTTAAAAPGPPASLAVAAAAAGELHVTWAPPLRGNGASIADYVLEMAPGGSGRGGGGSGKGGGGGKAAAAAAAAWTQVYKRPETACSVSGLLPGRTYQFRVRASSTQGLGQWCEAASGTTLPAEPSAPGRPVVAQRTATSLKARWALPADENGAPITGYVLQVRAAGSGGGGGGDGGGAFADAYVGVEMAARVAGLEAGTSYELRVAARNRVGQGPWSEVEAATTGLRPPPPPTGVTAEVDEGPPASLRVTWGAGGDPGPAAAEAVGYEVEALPCAPAPGGPAGAQLRQQVSRLEAATLAGATPGCTYNVHLRAVGAGGSGHSAWSEAVRVAVPVAAAAAAAATAAAAAGDGEGGELVSAGAGEEGGGAGKRKAGKKAKRAAAKDPAAAAAAAAAAQRRVPMQQSMAKVPKRRAGLLDTLLPPKIRRTLMSWLVWVVFGSMLVTLVLLALAERPTRSRAAAPP